MPVTVWCELVCEDCATSTAGRFTKGDIPRKKMQDEAKMHRWRIKGAVLCRTCAKNRDAKLK